MDKIPELLNADTVNKIKLFIDNSLESETKCPLGKGIFDMLGKRAIIVRYPLEDDNDAFLIRDLPSKKGYKNFVFINTNKTIEKQVFAAAHELGHLLDVAARVGVAKESEELVVNRFAAEVLMPELDFKEREKRKISKIERNGQVSLWDFLNIVVEAMDYYSTTFEAVILRFYELKIISKEDVETLLIGDNKDIVKKTVGLIINKCGYEKLQSVSKSRMIDGLDEVLDKLEANNEMIPSAYRLKEKYASITKKYEEESLDRTLKVEM